MKLARIMCNLAGNIEITISFFNINSSLSESFKIFIVETVQSIVFFIF